MHESFRSMIFCQLKMISSKIGTQFFVLVHVNDIWCCYAWDLKNNTVFIIDPLAASEHNALIIKKHCALTFWEIVPSHKWSFQWGGHLPSTVARLLFCTPLGRHARVTDWFTHINFDGTHMLADPSEVNLQNFKEYTYAWVEGDRARLPAAFVHLVDWVLQDTDIWHIR